MGGPVHCKMFAVSLISPNAGSIPLPQAVTQKCLQILQVSSEGRRTNCPNLPGTEGVLRTQALKFKTEKVLGKPGCTGHPTWGTKLPLIENHWPGGTENHLCTMNSKNYKYYCGVTPL